MSKTTGREEKALMKDCERHKDCTKKRHELRELKNRRLKRTKSDKRYNHYSNAHVEKMKERANQKNPMTEEEKAKKRLDERLKKRREKKKSNEPPKVLNPGKPYHPLGFTNLRY